MDEHLKGHGTHVPRPVIQLFLDLCQICQETKGKKSTHKIIHKPIIQETVGVRDRPIWWIYSCLKITATNSSQLPGLLQQVYHPEATKDQDSG